MSTRSAPTSRCGEDLFEYMLNLQDLQRKPALVRKRSLACLVPSDDKMGSVESRYRAGW
jgi:hypothetical protein